MENITIQPVLVGGDINCYSVARAYHEAYGVKSIAFGRYALGATKDSNIYIYQENAGQAVAVNRGLKLFNGDYLTWPDSDDWMPYDMIEKQVEYLSKHKEKGFVLNKCYYISDEDFTTVIRERTRENKDNGNIFRDLIMNRDVYWGAGAVMVRSTCFL